MKKLLLAVAGIILVFAFAAMAQDAAPAGKTSFGFKGGVSIGNLTGDSVKNAFDPAEKKTRMGMAGGVFLGYALAPSFTLQPEILYVQKGAKFEEGAGKVTFKLDYIEIPVLLKFTPAMQGKVAPTIFAGPYLGLLMSGKTKGEGWADAESNVEMDVKDSLKSTEFGVTFGGGFGYKMAKGELFFDVRLDLGMSKIVKKEAFDNADFDTKSSAFLAFVGYKFNF